MSRRRTGRRTTGRVAGVGAVAVALTIALVLTIGAAGAATRTVTVNDNYFKPKRVRVVVGDKVTWKWKGFLSHNVTVKKGPQKFKSRTQTDGRYSKVITKPGSYEIVCTLHPGMEMRLRAAPRPAVSTTTVPPST